MTRIIARQSYPLGLLILFFFPTHVRRPTSNWIMCRRGGEVNNGRKRVSHEDGRRIPNSYEQRGPDARATLNGV